MTFHMNPETGVISKCGAKSKKCPYGDDNHSDFPGYLARRYEEAHGEGAFDALVKKKGSVLELPMDEKNFPIFAAAKPLPDPEATLSRLATVEKKRILCIDSGSAIGEEGERGLFAIIAAEYGTVIYCESCDDLHDSDDFFVDFDEKSPTYLALKDENVSKMVWYHFTENPTWHEAIVTEDGAPAYVHLGGERAAADRGLQHSGDGYLYAVEIDSKAEIDPDIDQDGSSDYDPPGTSDVHRYLNRYEDPGSISVAVRPSALKVIGRAKVKLEQIERVSTYFLGNGKKFLDRKHEEHNSKGESLMLHGLRSRRTRKSFSASDRELRAVIDAAWRAS